MPLYELAKSSIGRCFAAVYVLIAGLVLSVALPSMALALEQVGDFGENPGELLMYLHRPAEERDNMPLVVALHGCQQTAEGFDEATGLRALAEQIPFLLLLPEQSEKNMSRRCFRWYDTDDNRPRQGESASILAMIDNLIEKEGVDPSRVYVLGLSAGGAMSAVLLSNYPSRFAGGAIFAGLPFDCNQSAGAFDFSWYWLHYIPYALDGADASYACGVAGFGYTNREAEQWAEFITQNAESMPEQWPLISLWQGTADETVDPDNLMELTEQWTAVQNIDTVVDVQQVFGNATREVYHDETGNPRVEAWSLQDFGHAVPIDTDGDPEDCGAAADYIVNADLCAVRRVAEFWGLL
ncbi:alpha/beta hydrolase family esterase [Granulosicoccus antarcticus]|uniref:Esterase PHB depolymerase n=1 Tax=Granulosicoccus antarcticus IMCC3135 TaxID=1192854 RepID=A0A2Z2NHW2_9GAMM|nr:PHB depolymerase family esterase [Granulosicoccus antarcticus]ASJ70633.1 hypothetical protein IMCC3135_02600 [Granulosicoccus antarcticus IMCC3135]